MGKSVRTKPSLSEIAEIGVPQTQKFTGSLNEMFGLPADYKAIDIIQDQSTKVVDPSLKPASSIDPSAAAKAGIEESEKPKEIPKTIPVTDIDPNNVTGSLTNAIKWFDNTIIEPVGKHFTEGAYSHPVKQAINLVNSGIIKDLPKTQFELNNLPKTQGEEDTLKELNQFGYLNGLPKNEKEQLVYKSPDHFNTHLKVTQQTFLEKLAKFGINGVDVNDPTQVGKANLLMNRIFADREADINMNNRIMIPTGTTSIPALTREGREKIEALHREKAEFENESVTTFRAAGAETYGADNIDSNQNIHAEEKLKYYDSKEYSKVMTGVKDPFVQKANEEYTHGAQLEKYIRDAEKISLHPSVQTSADKQEQLKSLSNQITQEVNTIQELGNKYPDVRKTELAKTFAEIYQRDKGGFGKGAQGGFGFDNYMTLGDEREIVQRFVESNASEVDKRLALEMLAEDEASMKLKLDKINRGKVEGRGDQVLETDTFEEVERFKNVKFGYGNKFAGAALEVFKGTGRGVRDILGLSSTKEGLEESVKDKLQLKGYELEQQRFFASPTILDLNEDSETFGQQIANPEAGKIQWRNFGYNMAEMGGQLVGQIGEAMLFEGLLAKGAKIGEFIKGGIESASAVRKTTPLMSNIVARTEEIAKLAKTSGEALELGLQRGIKAGKFGTAGLIEGEAQTLKDVASVVVPAFLMSYDQNLKHSYDLFGVDQPWKNRIYATLTAGLEGATEMIGNPLSQLKALKNFSFANAQENIFKFVKEIGKDGFEKMTRSSIKDKFIEILKNSRKHLGEALIEQSAEGTEEVVSNAGEMLTSYLLDPTSVKDRDLLNESYETYVQTFMGMAFMGLSAGRRVGVDAIHTFNNKHYKDAIIGVARNADLLVPYLDEMKAKGEISQADYDEKLRFIAVSKNQLAQAPKVNAATGNALTQDDMANYMYARVNEDYLDQQIGGLYVNPDGSVSTVALDRNRLDTLVARKKKLMGLREAAVNSGQVAYDTNGIPTLIMPELPESYEKKHEIIALRAAMKMQRKIINQLHQTGEDGKALARATALQQKINNVILEIKQKDPQTEEFKKFEEDKKKAAFELSIKAETNVDKLNEKLATATEDEKKIINSRLSEIKTKENTPAAPASSNLKTEAVNGEVKTERKNLVVGDIYMSPAGKYGVVTKLGNTPSAISFAWYNTLDKAKEHKDKQAATPPVQPPPSGSPLQSNIQGQPPAQKPTGDSQATQNNKPLTKPAPIGTPPPKTGATPPPVSKTPPVDVKTQVANKISSMPPVDQDDIDILNTLGYSGQQDNLNEDFLSPVSAEDRNGRFETLIKRVSDKTGKTDIEVQDIMDFIEGVVGKEQVEKLRESVESDYEAYYKSYDKSLIEDLYGEQLQEEIPIDEQTTQGWTERHQIAANAKLVDDTSEAAKPVIDQKRRITWLGNKIITPVKKLAFRNLLYKERVTTEGDRVFKSDINELFAKDILNWKKYGVNSKFTVEYNPNLKVYDWDENIDTAIGVDVPSKGEIPFEQLALEEGTDEWIDKIPIQLYDEENNLVDGVFIHDVDWYNPSNVGDVENQAEIIEEAKAELRQLRRKIYEAYKKGEPFEIEISDKTLGTKEEILLSIPELPTIHKNNPQSKIGFVTGNADKTVVAEGELIEGALIEGIEMFVSGQPIELRKISEERYIAIHPVYSNFSNASYVRTTMKTAFGIYMLLNRPHNVNELSIDGTIMTKDQAALLNKEFKKKGIDLSIPLGITTYLRTFVEVYADRPDASQLEEGTVYAVMKSGVLSVYRNSIGNLSESLAGEDISKSNPTDLQNKFNNIFNEIQFARMNILNMEKLESMKNSLIFLRHHADSEGKTKFIITPYKSQSEAHDNRSSYAAFLKDHMKTNYKSWNIGTEEEPMYVTLVQPVIQIKEAGVEEKTLTEITNEEKAKEQLKEAEEAIKRQEALAKRTQEEIEKQEQQEKQEQKEKEIAIATQEIVNEVVNDSIEILNKFGLRMTTLGELSPGFTEAQRLEVTKSINTIEGLSEDDKHTMENFILATIFKNLNAKYGGLFTEEEFAEEVKISFDSYFGDKLLVLEEQQRRIETVLELNQNVKLSSVNEAYKQHVNSFSIIKEHWDEIRDNILELEVKKYVQFKEIDYDSDEQDQNTKNVDGEYEKQHDKEGYTENYKNSVSLFVKRFVFTIPNYLQGKPVIGFMGVETYNRFEDNYNILMELVPGDNQILSNKEILQSYLDSPSIPDIHKPLAREVANMVRSNTQFNHGLQYSMTKSNLTMKMIMEEYDRNKDEYRMRLMDVNANSAQEAIRQQWLSNHRISKFLKISQDTETAIINDAVRTEIMGKIDKWAKQKTYSQEDIQDMADMLADMGIKIDSKAISLLLTDGFYKPEKVAGKSKKITGQKMFTDVDGTFFRINEFLKGTIKSEKGDINFHTNSALNIFEQEPTSIKRLVGLNNKFLGFIPTQSFRDGEKSIYAYENMMMDKQTMMGLKNNDTLRKTKLQTLFDKHSYILQLMDEDEDVRKATDIQTSGLTSIKIRGKEVYGSSEVKDLADIDFERFAVSLFTHKSVKVDKTTKQGIPLRMTTMLGLVSSDKKRRNLMFAPVLALDSTFVDVKTGRIEEGERGDKVRDFLFSQLALPELERIIQHHSYAKANNLHPNAAYNQKDYNFGAQMFLMIPELNNVTIGENKQPILDYIANTDNLDLQDIIAKTKTQLTEVIERYINQEVDAKFEKWKGYFTEDKEVDDYDVEMANFGAPIEATTAVVTKVKHMDSAYMNPWGVNAHDKLRGTAIDYVINTAVMNANQFMLFSGDVANFAQDKSFSSGFETKTIDGKEFPQVHILKEGTTYSDVVRKKIGVNLGKRLAMLIAPGAMLSESIGDTYLQILVQDAVRIADNTLDLIKLFHGEDEYKKAKVLVAELDHLNNILSTTTNLVGLDDARKRKDAIIKQLRKDYKDLSSYFNIESTDAQEYTTWKEHLDVLLRQGRVNDEEYNRITDKLANNKELKEKDLKLIFQPIKPVYTGVIAEKIENTDLFRNRTLYIKSSSFPLLPQLTKGLELNKLRLDMEKLQSSSGLNVRLSHGTANKVGSTSAPIKIWNEDGSYNKNGFRLIRNSEINDNTSKSALRLNRTNFRIQQDVPYKSSKRKEDKISIGSQLMKILFSDDVKDIIGADVFENYQQSFITWSNNERDNLYRELKYNPKTHTQSPETIVALKEMLRKEALNRNYSKQDVDILSSILNSNEFKIPLWLSPNSNRYEAFINAIVTSRLINLKLPGSSFVLGSEEGFIRDFQEAVAENRMVYLPNWTGKLKANQVLLPSKFRDNNGKLIDLTSNDYSTLNTVTGQRYLKMEMFDAELLNLTSFRIPTSSHVSGSQMEVAGFIPVESGDLAIYPKGLTKQKGFDFDVDKENTYWLSHFVDTEGKIKVLNKTEVVKTLEEFRKLLDSYKPLIQRGNLKEGEEGLNLIIRTFNKVFGDDSVIDAKKNIDSLFKLLKNKLETKLAQNEIIKIHSLVFNSKDERIQKKIQQVLSTDFAEEQADLIEDITSGTGTGIFSLLSDEYQKYKMNLGATGKTGIGVYSNYVTWHGLSQQTSKRIGLETLIDGKAEPYELVIGNMKSNGLFGNTDTIKPSDIEDSVWSKVKRSISFAFAERQNTATDNEKLQVMGRVGVNGNTINVDCLLTALGFDKDMVKDKDGNDIAINIPYFLLSQPIIKEYVEKLKNAGSQVADFDIAKKETIRKDLIQKFGGSLISDDIKDGDESLLTGQELYNNLTVRNDKIQQIALNLFSKLSDIADKVQVLQSNLNIQRSGLGESFFEAQSKLDNLINLSTGSAYSTESVQITNTDTYIGSVLNKADYFNLPIEDRINYTRIDDNTYMKPVSFTGVMMADSLKTYKDIFEKYFPNKSDLLNDTINKIIKNIGKDQVSTAQNLILKYEIAEEIKKYLLSSAIGLYDDAQEERKRLMFDTSKQKSLAKYLYDLKYSENEAIVNTNALLKTFDYEFNKDGKPSMIKYRNSRGEDVEEEYKYQALVKLLHDNKPLPPFNGDKEYTTTKLVADLISYAYVTGGVQLANEYIKYIPVKIIETLGIDIKLRRIHTGLTTNDREWYNTVFGDEGSRFEQQFFQHNPKRAKKLEVRNITAFKNQTGGNLKKFSEAVYEFQVDSEQTVGTLPQYVHIYNERKQGKGNDKYQLYKLTVDENDIEVYKRIPVLGMTGMVEYDSNSSHVLALLDVKKEKKKQEVPNTIKDKANTPPPSSKNTPPPPSDTPPPEGTQPPSNTPPPKEPSSNPYNIESGNLNEVLNNIEAIGLPYLSDLVGMLKSFINPQTKIKLVSGVSFNGKYTQATNTIEINSSLLNSPNLAAIIVKEYAHSITVGELEKYFDYDNIHTALKQEYTSASTLKNPDGSQLIKVPPMHIVRLHMLYDEMHKKLKDTPEFKSMEAKIINLKRNKGKDTLDAKEFGVYGLINIFEFTSEIFADRNFQKLLAATPSNEANKSLFDKFLDIISVLFNKLGVPANTKLRDALVATFEVIAESNKPVADNLLKYKNPLQQQADINAIKTPPPTSLTKETPPIRETPPPKFKSPTPPVDQEEDTKAEDFDDENRYEIVNIEERRNEEISTISKTLDKSEYDAYIKKINAKYDKELQDLKDGKTVIAHVHVLAEDVGVDTDTDEFRKTSEDITGEGHLDKMSEAQLNQMINYLHTLDEAEKPEPKSTNTKYELFPGKYANEKQEIAIDKVIEFLNADTGNSNEWHKDQFLLKGRGGTGKTTIIKKALEGKEGVVGATVSDEAKGILKENLPDHKCVTVASLLGLVPDYTKKGELFFRERNAQEEKEFRDKDKYDPIESANIILIDESSMISPYLYQTMLAKKLPWAKIIFMGDNAQIPPIDDNGGTIESPVFELQHTPNFAELTIRMRQGEESPILPITDVFAENVENIQKGLPYLKNPLTQQHRTNNYTEDSNEGILFITDPNELVNAFLKDFQSSDDLKTAVIVAARNEKVNAVNSAIRNKMFDSPTSPYVIGDVIRTNAPLVEKKQIILHNGMRGRVTNVRVEEVIEGYQTYRVTFDTTVINEQGKPEPATRSVLTIDPLHVEAFFKKGGVLAKMAAAAKAFPKGSSESKKAWAKFFSVQEKVANVGYNYAITSHKVQGSTYKNTYVIENDILTFPGGDLQTNRMMYTAVSRPKFKLVIYNPVQAVNTVQVIPTKQEDIQYSSSSNDLGMPPAYKSTPPIKEHPPIVEDFDGLNHMNTEDIWGNKPPSWEEDSEFSPMQTEITEDNIDSMLEELGITKTCD